MITPAWTWSWRDKRTWSYSKLQLKLLDSWKHIPRLNVPGLEQFWEVLPGFIWTRTTASKRQGVYACVECWVVCVLKQRERGEENSCKGQCTGIESFLRRYLLLPCPERFFACSPNSVCCCSIDACHASMSMCKPSTAMWRSSHTNACMLPPLCRPPLT